LAIREVVVHVEEFYENSREVRDGEQATTENRRGRARSKAGMNIEAYLK
jgi:hypothetical protein